LVKQCLAYVRLFRIAFAQQAHPDNAMWLCQCTVCNGRELAWLAQRPPEERERLAFEHSLETLLDIRDELLAPGLTTLERRLRWCDRCGTAQDRHLEVGWPPLAALARWREELLVGKPKQERLK